MDSKKVQDNENHEYYFKNEKPITKISQDKKGLDYRLIQSDGDLSSQVYPDCSIYISHLHR